MQERLRERAPRRDATNLTSKGPRAASTGAAVRRLAVSEHVGRDPRLRSGQKSHWEIVRLLSVCVIML